MSLGNKILAVLLLVLFMSTMFFSLFHVSMSMDMSGGMEDCPFMSHGETICPMNLADHIEAWKAVFVSAIQATSQILLGAVFVVFVFVTNPKLIHLSKLRLRYLVKYSLVKNYSFATRSLQEFFSNGILNPKLY